MTNKLAPEYLCDLVPKPVSDSNQYNLRNKTKLQTINCRTKIYEKSFLPDTTKIWNTLPEELASANSLGEFKTLVKNVISENYLDRNFGSRFCQLSIGANADFFFCHSASSLHHSTPRWQGVDAF